MSILIDRAYRTSVTIENAIEIGKKLIAEDQDTLNGVALLLYRIFWDEAEQDWYLAEPTLRYLLQELVE
jgi:hypothetical protein|tara:strand:+ start:727 stop:933 length:207 start_codon:yes stop_codon:yes gene_type:complete